MYDIQSFYKAANVKDAVRALEANPQAVVIAGGTDVLVKIREGKLAGRDLISIHDLPELKGIFMEEDGTILIRPCTSFSQIEWHPLIQQKLPMLAQAVGQVGGPQIRNMGTVGGNLCNGVTSADSASTLLAMDAQLELEGPKGTRRLPLREFYAGPGRTVREHEELLTAIRVRKEDYEGFCGYYIKYAQRSAMDIATLGCAAYLRLSPDKTHIEQLRLAYGVAAPTPIRCGKAEQAAQGQRLDQQLLERIGEAAVSEVNPRTSWRASREFRLQLVRELAKRAITQAVVKGGGEIHA